jgi:3-oxoadipate CoA-transferase, beta subunit
LVERCTYPITGVNCVSRVYTDYGVFEVTPNGFVVRELVDGLTADALSSKAQLAFLA